MFINKTSPAPNMRRMSPIAEQKYESKRFLPWFWPDNELAESIDLRRKEFIRNPDSVLRIGETAVQTAASRLLVLQADYLAYQYPDAYTLENSHVINKITDERFSLNTDNSSLDALAISGLLGQEDICMVEQQDDERHIMAAGFVASPTDWDLPKFIGLGMDQVHAKVAGYSDRLKATVDRSLISLPEFPERQFARNNIFLEQNSALAIFPSSKPQLDPATISDPGNEIYLRTERETLTRLPSENRRFIVFTIKPHVYRLADVAANNRHHDLADAIVTNKVLRRNEALALTALDYLLSFDSGN